MVNLYFLNHEYDLYIYLFIYLLILNKSPNIFENILLFLHLSFTFLFYTQNKHLSTSVWMITFPHLLGTPLYLSHTHFFKLDKKDYPLKMKLQISCSKMKLQISCRFTKNTKTFQKLWFYTILRLALKIG